jgi:hypothetical protein
VQALSENSTPPNLRPQFVFEVCSKWWMVDSASAWIQRWMWNEFFSDWRQPAEQEYQAVQSYAKLVTLA